MSLRARILIGGAILQLVLLLVLAWSGSRVFSELMARQVQSDAQRTVALLGTTLAAPLLQRDIASVHSILVELRERGAISYIGVTDRVDRVIAEVGARGAEPRPDPWGLPFMRSAAKLDHSGPVGFENQELGRILLQVSGDSIRQTESRLRWNLLGYGLAIALLFAVLMAALGTVLLRSIRRVAQASREISQGRFDTRIPGEGSDDFGVLVKNFNLMAGEIKRRIVALESSEQVQRLALSAGGFRGEVFEVALHAPMSLGERQAQLAASIASKCPEDVREEVRAALPGALAHGGGGRCALVVRSGAPLDPRWTELCALIQPVSQAVDDRVRVALAFRDVSDRVRLEEALRQSQKTEALGLMAGGLAHDLGNALTVSYSGLDLLKRRAGEDPALVSVTELLRGATDRCLAITRALMDFARGTPVKVEECDLNDELFKVRPLIAAGLGSRVSLEVTLCREPLRATIDTGALANALINLSVNARDALEGASEKRVVLRTRLDRGARPGTPGEVRMAVVEFYDTGCGMSPEVAARAFDPFFTTKPSGKGSGLGLSTVLTFAKNSGGVSTISTAPGEGTMVSIWIPVAHP